MTKSSKSVVPFVLALLLALLAGCSVEGDQRKVFDDDARIAAEGDTYTFQSRIGKTEDRQATLSIRGFYGSNTLWTFDAPQDGTLKLKYQMTIEGGRFKTVLVNPDRTVTVLSENSAKGEAEVPLRAGKSMLKLVGSNAVGDLRLELAAMPPGAKATPAE